MAVPSVCGPHTGGPYLVPAPFPFAAFSIVTESRFRSRDSPLSVMSCSMGSEIELLEARLQGFRDTDPQQDGIGVGAVLRARALPGRRAPGTDRAGPDDAMPPGVDRRPPPAGRDRAEEQHRRRPEGRRQVTDPGVAAHDEAAGGHEVAELEEVQPTGQVRRGVEAGAGADLGAEPGLTAGPGDDDRVPRAGQGPGQRREPPGWPAARGGTGTGAARASPRPSARRTRAGARGPIKARTAPSTWPRRVRGSRTSPADSARTRRSRRRPRGR